MSAAVLSEARLRKIALLFALVTSAGLVTLESTLLHLFVASAFILWKPDTSSPAQKARPSPESTIARKERSSAS